MNDERVIEFAFGREWEKLQRAAERLLERWTVRCAAPDCRRGVSTKLALFTRSSGVQYNNRWYHQSDCLRAALATRLSQMLQSFAETRERVHRLPFGLLLVNRGIISAQDLREALRLQREAGYGKLSLWLQQLVPLHEEEVTAALGQQWGCPVFHLTSQSMISGRQNPIPFPILAAAKAVPVHASHTGKLMHIAFSERVDHTLLYAVEEMLGCRTVACVSTESTVREALERLRREDAGNEITFDTVRDPNEMASTICNYAVQMDARRIKAERAGAYIWVAFFRKDARRELLFRLPGARGSEIEISRERGKAFLPSVDYGKDGVSHAARYA